VGEGEELMPAIVAPIIAAAALAQWLVFAFISLLSRRPAPRGTRVRTAEKRLTISSAVFAFVWLAIFAAPLVTRTNAVQAQALTASTSHGSCATVEPGMTADAVAAKAGQPDEKRPNEDARGPGAVIWIYRDARCAVHLFDGKVEAID
jgi:hypothetical protein